MFISEKLFSALDQDNDGYLSSSEFIEGLKQLYTGDFEHTLKIIFNMLDFNKDGEISKEDIKVASIIHQIASGIKYLHQYGIVHRDLKPENIMLTEPNDNGRIKIMDFGLSKIMGPHEKANDGFGTINFVAPEVLLRNPNNKSVDIWSIGIILYYLLSGQLPFDDPSDNDEVIAKITVFNEV